MQIVPNYQPVEPDFSTGQILVRRGNHAAPQPQMLPPEEAVKQLRQVQANQLKFQKEAAETQAKLAEAREEALRIQEELENLTANRDRLQSELKTAEGFKSGTVQRVEEINRYARNFFVGGSGLADHATEMVRHDFVLARIDGFLDQARAELAQAEKDLASFAKKFGE